MYKKRKYWKFCKIIINNTETVFEFVSYYFIFTAHRVEKIPRDEVSIENSERQSAGSRKRARHSEPNQSERTGTDGDFERFLIYYYSSNKQS
jgi:hypothetical protein